jgi:hypothetical protein
MPAHSFATRYLGKALATLDLLDPAANFGDGDEQDIAAARLERRVMRRRMYNALDRWRHRGGPGQHDGGHVRRRAGAPTILVERGIATGTGAQFKPYLICAQRRAQEMPFDKVAIGW